MALTLEQFHEEMRERLRTSESAAFLARCASCGEYVMAADIPAEGTTVHEIGKTVCGPVYILRRSELGPAEGECPCGLLQACTHCHQPTYRHVHVRLSAPGAVLGVTGPTTDVVWCLSCHLEAKHLPLRIGVPEGGTWEQIDPPAERSE